MKVYSTLPRTLELEPNHQMQFSVISRTPPFLGRSLWGGGSQHIWLHIYPWPSHQSEILCTGCSHGVERKCEGVMKWYKQMLMWDMGSRNVSLESVSEQLTAGFRMSIPWPRSRSAKWGLEDNTVWSREEVMGQCGSFHSSLCICLSDLRKLWLQEEFFQLAGAVEYTDCISAEG